MIAQRKRGRGYHADLMVGQNHVARGSLGTRNQDAARRSIHKLESALAEGPLSPLWNELQMTLPHPTYKRFADFAGVKAPHLPTWPDLRAAFTVLMEQRRMIGKLAPSTVARYEVALREFGVFLERENILFAERCQQAAGGTLQGLARA